ncbi:MAG: LysR family transcriptional regulator [Gammaproteobacteria bacterium]|nr:LysR family transcriptional regulator [Gammaproteobacteria bacterium]MAY02653.1 LysR family transcriptional regulator [Gammaproteobacteria bacterium]|tara:strand:+ start:1701 stop:2582 length:882 start_codon:yes stop_codon:yes gene_type:complete
MNKFIEMQSFRAVVNSGSFVKAADELGVSKAAVSRYVSDLESRLGVRLLQRTTRRLSLTEEGEIFNNRSRDILAELEEAENEISSRSSSVSGQIRVNAPVSFGIKYLAGLWGKFHDLYPNVTLDITLSDQLVDLLDDNFDIAIRISRLTDSSLISKKLSTTRMMLCASPSYLQKAGEPIQPMDLLEHQIIAYSYWSGGNEWRFDGPEGPQSIKIKPWINSNNGETCLAMALENEGIILQPSFLVEEYIAKKHLKEILPEYKSIELGIYAMYPSRKHVASKTRALVNFLSESLN